MGNPHNMEAWLIIFCCYTGQLVEPDSQMILRPDSVFAFGIAWETVDYKIDKAEGDVIYHGEFVIYWEGFYAEIVIRNRKVWFIFPPEEHAHMIQLPHYQENDE